MGDKMEGIWKARRHSALSHDGVDDYEEIAASASLDITDAITIEVWIYPRVGGEEYYVTKNPPTDNYRLGISPEGTTSFYLGLPGGMSLLDVKGVIQISKDVWHHVVATYNSDTGKAVIYHNGEVDKEFTGLSGTMNTGGNLYLGCRTTSTYNFNGSIASVRIYNRALSEAEVKYLYYNPDDPLDTDHLVLWLHPGSIDTDAGYWWDISGNDNHGQIFGATKVSLVSPEVTVL